MGKHANALRFCRLRASSGVKLQSLEIVLRSLGPRDVLSGGQCRLNACSNSSDYMVRFFFVAGTAKMPVVHDGAANCKRSCCQTGAVASNAYS